MESRTTLMKNTSVNCCKFYNHALVSQKRVMITLWTMLILLFKENKLHFILFVESWAYANQLYLFKDFSKSLAYYYKYACFSSIDTFTYP